MSHWKICLFVASSLLPAQTGRFEEHKRLATSYVETGKFDKAAGKLEEVWDQDRSDPWVAEFLAIAYLNGDDRRTQKDLEGRAAALMEKAATSGGRATFLMLHSHEKLGFIQGNRLTKYCSGRLSVSPQRLVFVSQAGDRASEHSFDLPAAALQEVDYNRGAEYGMFHVKTKDKTYNMAPRTGLKRDTELMMQLVNKHLAQK